MDKAIAVKFAFIAGFLSDFILSGTYTGLQEKFYQLQVTTFGSQVIVCSIWNLYLF
jgi:hypothetical protein